MARNEYQKISCPYVMYSHTTSVYKPEYVTNLRSIKFLPMETSFFYSVPYLYFFILTVPLQPLYSDQFETTPSSDLNGYIYNLV